MSTARAKRALSACERLMKRSSQRGTCHSTKMLRECRRRGNTIFADKKLPKNVRHKGLDVWDDADHALRACPGYTLNGLRRKR